MKTLPTALRLLCLAAITTRAQTTTTSSNEFYSSSFSTLSSAPTSDFTGSQYSYLTLSGQSTVTSSSTSGNDTSTSTGSDSQSTRSTSSVSLTLLGGTAASTTDGTASSTSTGAAPTNTVPCNGYPEFCNRKYSNITQVCAHNSAFSVKNNAGSNQELKVRVQLDDGIRMIQGETHWVNETVYNCHTTCSLLNAGPWQSELEIVADWLDSNPYDVVTWLIVNSDFRPVTDYVSAIQNSGIAKYLYEPAYVPQHLDQWPTLGELIISGKRLIMFMDYNANQTEVPYIMDEFTHMWETPFSPQNQSFPCTQQRPPNLNQTLARDQYMYLANHNLNTAVDLSALTGSGGNQVILIPNTAEINQTNGQYDTFGQLGAMSNNCTADWGRPPNFLLVDYYNLGDPQMGSVFEVAAKANGVNYTYGHCCGLSQSGAPALSRSSGALVAALVFALVILL